MPNYYKYDHELKIKGSAAEPYKVEVTYLPFSIDCSCPAGEFNHEDYKPICKHCIQILQGKDPGLDKKDDLTLEKIAEASQVQGAKEAAKSYEVSKAKKMELEKKSEKSFKNYVDQLVLRFTGDLKTENSVDNAHSSMEKAIGELVPVLGALSNAGKYLKPFLYIKVVKKEEEQYRKALKDGNEKVAHDHAGRCAEAWLKTKNEEKYHYWKGIKKEHAAALGL